MIISRDQVKSFVQFPAKAYLSQLDPEMGFPPLNLVKLVLYYITPVHFPKINMIRRRKSSNNLTKSSATSAPFLNMQDNIPCRFIQ